MILHNVMWESRPLPKIVRDPLAAHSARGSFFVPGPPGIFLLGKEWTAELPPVLLRPLMPRRSRQKQLCLVESLTKCSSPNDRPNVGQSPLKGSLAGRRKLKLQADRCRLEAGESPAGRETFLEKGSPSPHPTLPKTFVGEPGAEMGEPVEDRRAVSILVNPPPGRTEICDYRGTERRQEEDVGIAHIVGPVFLLKSLQESCLEENIFSKL